MGVEYAVTKIINSPLTAPSTSWLASALYLSVAALEDPLTYAPSSPLASPWYTDVAVFPPVEAVDVP